MSAFEQPKTTSLSIGGIKVYKKGVDQSTSLAISDTSNLTSAVWSLTNTDGDFALSKDGTSFGQDAENQHIEVAIGANIQFNTAPTDFHQSNWQLDVYKVDGSVQHIQGGGAYFLLDGGLPSDAVFAELMLGPVPSNSQDTSQQTDTLAYIMVSGQTDTELFYVDTSDSQDGSAFGLLLDQAGHPLTRGQIEGGMIDVQTVQVAEVDYQPQLDQHNYDYPAPTRTTDFVELGFSPAPPIGPDGSWTAPTLVSFDDQMTTLINGGTNNDMLDLSGITGVYELDAGFGSWDLDPAYYNSDVGIIFIGDQYYEFESVESYKVTGLSSSGTGETIRFNALDDVNETIEIGAGFGLNINLGVGELSDSDVAVFTGGSVDIDLSTADSSGYVTYSYLDGSGTGSIRGADIIIGGDSGTGDSIVGSDQRDVIVGLAGDDVIHGGLGDDFIIGGAGADRIDGGDGDDIIVDLDSDLLTGGEGRDVFVVNGMSADGSATITDLDVSEDGLSFRGLDTDKYADRIAFSFNASVLATALSTASGLDITGLSDPLNPDVYYQLARALDIEVLQNTSETGPDYDLIVSYTDEFGTQGLGKVGFNVSNRPLDKPAFNEADHVYKATLLQAEEVDKQLTEALLDQIASYATDGVDLPSTESITLFVGVERADKNAIFGDGEPVLVAYQPEGVQIATKFRPSNADEVMLGSSDSDVYAHSAQVFINETSGTATGDQDFGRDTVVERGGANDVISLEASLSDLLVGHLELGRMERGREGDDRSLNIRYNNDPSDSGDLNGVDLIVYKQFVDYDSTFRVEGLELVDPSGGYHTLSFGEAVSDSELEVDGATDAILVGRDGQADTFTVRDSGSGTAELYMVGFEHGIDQLVFAGDENAILSSDPADYADGFEQVTVTGVEGSVTYDIHFVSSIDDDLTTNIPA